MWAAIKWLQSAEGGGPTVHMDYTPTLEAGTGYTPTGCVNA